MARRYLSNALISDPITHCSSLWKRRYCGDSAAEWSQHQWKKCKKYLCWRSSWFSDRERERSEIGGGRGRKQREGAKRRSRERGRSRRLFRESIVLVCIFAENSFISIFFPNVNQSIPLFKGECMFFPFSFPPSFSLYPSSFPFSHLCKEIFADIFANGCLKSLLEELWAGMALRERAWRHFSLIEMTFNPKVGGIGRWWWAVGAEYPSACTRNFPCVATSPAITLCKRDGSGWPLGTCYTLTETISLSISYSLVFSF